MAFTHLLCNPQNPFKETLLLPCAILRDTEAHGDWLKATQLGTDSLGHEPRRSGCNPLTQMPGQLHLPTTHRIFPGTTGQVLRASSGPHQWACSLIIVNHNDNQFFRTYYVLGIFQNDSKARNYFPSCTEEGLFFTNIQFTIFSISKCTAQ